MDAFTSLAFAFAASCSATVLQPASFASFSFACASVRRRRVKTGGRVTAICSEREASVIVIVIFYY